MHFHEVALEDWVAWDFESGKINEPYVTPFDHAFEEAENKGNVLRFDLNGGTSPGKRLIEIKQYPRSVPRDRIGGVRFDLKVSEEFNAESMQIILQSKNAFWIPCEEISLSEAKKRWPSFAVEIQNKKKIEAMAKGFAVLMLLPKESDMHGSICIDNLGFLLRPEN